MLESRCTFNLQREFYFILRESGVQLALNDNDLLYFHQIRDILSTTTRCYFLIRFQFWRISSHVLNSYFKLYVLTCLLFGVRKLSRLITTIRGIRIRWIPKPSRISAIRWLVQVFSAKENTLSNKYTYINTQVHSHRLNFYETMLRLSCVGVAYEIGCF